jgi:hypothetical protein
MSVARRLPLSLIALVSAADELVKTNVRDRFWGGTPPFNTMYPIRDVSRSVNDSCLAL